MVWEGMSVIKIGRDMIGESAGVVARRQGGRGSGIGRDLIGDESAGVVVVWGATKGYGASAAVTVDPGITAGSYRRGITGTRYAEHQGPQASAG